MAWPLKSVLLTVMCLACHETMVQSRKSVFREKQLQIGQNASQRNKAISVADDKEYIRFGIILPKTSLITLLRQYYKKINDSLDSLKKGRNAKFNYEKYNIGLKPLVVNLPLDPSPTVVLNALCDDMLPQDVVSILYFTNSEVYGSNAASAQYLLQLTGYLGIPVIAWNADNIGLEKVICLKHCYLFLEINSLKANHRSREEIHDINCEYSLHLLEVKFLKKCNILNLAHFVQAGRDLLSIPITKVDCLNIFHKKEDL